MKNYKNNINASSMADIAFLLLIFFLVSTTIDLDKGILNKLPQDSEQPSAPLNKKNVLEVAINSLDQIMIEGQLGFLENVNKYTQDHVLNYGKNPNLSDSPKEAVVLLEIERGASYDLYIQIQNELKLAYTEIRNDQSLKQTDGDYDYAQLKVCIEKADYKSATCREIRNSIKKQFPMILIEK